MENVNSGKRFLIIGIIVAVAILAFTAVFLYFSSKDMDEMEKQLADLKEEYKTALAESGEYDSLVQGVDANDIIKEVSDKGNEVASIENQMCKFTFENVNPMDAPSENSLIDKKVRDKLKALFSEDDVAYTDQPWLVGKDLTCKFNPMFQYKAGKIAVTWVCESNNRPAALITASYNPKDKVFEDLHIYKTMFGTTVTEEAYDLMAHRANGDDTTLETPDKLDVVDESEEPEGTMLFDDEDGEATIDDAPVPDEVLHPNKSTNKNNTEKEGE